MVPSSRLGGWRDTLEWSVFLTLQMDLVRRIRSDVAEPSRLTSDSVLTADRRGGILIRWRPGRPGAPFTLFWNGWSILNPVVSLLCLLSVPILGGT
jgi:hypothetical protein